MKRKCWFVMGVVFFLLFGEPASASTITGATIEVSPKQGDITTEILVKVRGEPHIADFLTAAGDVPVLYLYYDDKIIISRMKCLTYPKYLDYSTYEAVWDVTFQIPNEYPYSELGIHNITAIIEASDGTTAKATATFKVVNYIPPPEWWEDLPQEFISKITGPQGPEGDKGDTGPYPMEMVALSLGVSITSAIISVIALIMVYKIKKEW